MGDFPSGQRGQTVNLLAMPSVVRIHHPPPKQKPSPNGLGFLFCFGEMVGFEPNYIQVSGGHLLTPVQTLVATSISHSHSGMGNAHRIHHPPPTKTKHLSTDKCSVFVYPGRRLGISLTHEVRRISSAPLGLYLITRKRAFPCGLMIYNTSC